MGNNQSAEAPRKPPNRLSKPRTNTSGSTHGSTPSLLAPKLAAASRRNSQTRHEPNPNDRYSRAYSVISPVEAIVDEAGEQRGRGVQTQWKRLSIFRSKSAQPTVPQLDIVSGVNIEYTDATPVDRYRRSSLIHAAPEYRHSRSSSVDASPIDRFSRQSSITSEVQGDHQSYVNPAES